MNRRTFCRTLTGSLLVAQGCSRPEPPPPEASLSELLGLRPSEASWLGALRAEQQAELRAALAARSGPPSARTVELLMKVIGPRGRLTAYVGYPRLANRLEGCDGLIRE